MKQDCPLETTTEFVNALVCDASNKDCMTLRCPECCQNYSTYTPNDADSANSPIVYQQWQNTEKVEIKSTANEAYEELQRQLKGFLIHVYMKRKQACFMNETTRSVDGVNIGLQVDFSENASLNHQDEIQSVHWSHAQATLFTAYAWVDSAVTESYVIVSDELRHTKLSVYTFMETLFADLKTKYPNIRKISVFSDGASSQFKQRFQFSNLHLWEAEFGVKLTWHFSATSHGKGVVDGIGGTVKRAVWRCVRSGNGQATSPVAFYDLAKLRNAGVDVKYVSQETIQQKKEMLEAHWSNTIPVANTHQLHFVKSRGDKYLLVGQTSDSRELSEVRISEDTLDDNIESITSESQDATSTEECCEISKGDWVVIK